MSIFNIKLKTKNGNDIKKKETFTVFFRINYKVSALSKKKSAQYTYRIMTSKGVIDPKCVLDLKNSDNVESIEDLTVKVMLNFCHIIGNFSKSQDINPDFIMFMSPDLCSKKNRAWMFLKDAFPKAKKLETEVGLDLLLDEETTTYDDTWTEAMCAKFKVKKDELDLLRSFVELNPKTHFMSLDPNFNPKKYVKSIHVCNMLQDRIDGKLQIAEDIIE